MANNLHLHDLKILFIEEKEELYTKLFKSLNDLNNELVKISFEDEFQKEFKIFKPDIVVIHKEIESKEDLNKIEAIQNGCLECEIILVTQANDIKAYEFLLRLDIKIILKPIDSLKILDTLGRISKNQRIANSLSVETKMMGIGDIVGNIAHQWRQPLNRLSGIMLNISAANDFNKLTPELVEEKLKQADDTIKYLSHTIEDFKRFYSNNRLKENFDVETVIKEGIDLTTSPSSDFVQLHFIVNNNCTLFGYRKEFFQSIVNILHNAKDQLKIKKIEKPTITITLGKNEELCYILIEDNAGGIEVEPIEKIFYPYKTTKKNSGTGLGLYITKMIIEEKMKGTITATNTKSGAKFHISLPVNTI